ncbi:FAD-binding domain-containing protein [Pannus brasiliensis CCIBt3594]|uniref:FAD-binding domain-containing protein n=1 Tax=Pannus brasiliensis CCIBt3594 TaxID=1427578 RepID=A0AAW9R071_9CHRO
MPNLILFWHRRDLRLSDNLGLAKACHTTPKVVGVFCLDRALLERDDIAPARVAYLIGCLQELERNYREKGSQLLVIHGEPAKAIPHLAVSLQAKAVFFNLDVEPYARERDKAVTDALREQSIDVQTFWDQLLHAPGEVVTLSKTPYTVYTPFWKNWSQLGKESPTSLESLQGLDESERDLAKKAGAIELPPLENLGFRWDNPLILSPGESAALTRLEEFCQDTIYNYEENRNYPAIDGTSHLGAALKFGAIGIRTVWEASIEALENCRSEETRAGVISWQQELAWREFYQHCLYFFPELADGPYRKEFRDFPWEDNEEHFQAWCEGKTGYPIVDAAMRQMNETGWMHNRCRMIVASFLTKDLILNWQRGEKYFYRTLYDGDLAANNGGWQWSASSGMDPKPLRIFNPATQAAKYDPEAEYIRQWLPELASLDTEELLSGKISRLDRHRCGYPDPIVDHNQQQREFKKRYQQQKLG